MCVPRCRAHAALRGRRAGYWGTLTGICMNSSKSSTGLFTDWQHDQDLRPSWKTGAPGWYVQLSGALFAGSKSLPQPL